LSDYVVFKIIIIFKNAHGKEGKSSV
jgi:hypothetical protein